MSATNPYAPPKTQAVASKLEELRHRFPDYAEELTAVANAGNQGPFPLRPRPWRLLALMAISLLVGLLFTLSRLPP